MSFNEANGRTRIPERTKAMRFSFKALFQYSGLVVKDTLISTFTEDVSPLCIVDSQIRYHEVAILFAVAPGITMTAQTITATTSTCHSTAIAFTVMTLAASKGSSSSSALCTSSSCPVTHAQDTGIYTPVSANEMSPEARRMFKPSIPPLHVLAAFERCLHEGILKEDVKLWVSFHESHTEPLIDDIHLRWVAPVRADDIEGYLDSILDQANLGSMTTTNSNVARHPFGLANPPDDVWAAHARLQQGQSDGRDPELAEKDREFVRAFSADSGYCAQGVGKQVANVRRFKVRRLNYVRQLAEIRRRRR